MYVADRENSRVQLFKPDGEYIDEWTHVTRPDDLFIDSAGIMHVAELGEIAGRSPDTEILPHTPHAERVLDGFGWRFLLRDSAGKTPCYRVTSSHPMESGLILTAIYMLLRSSIVAEPIVVLYHSIAIRCKNSSVSATAKW